MNKFHIFQLGLATAALVACQASLQAAPPSAGVVVTCVGDSITAGYGLSSGQSYPSQLQALLGSGYTVKNFGVSSTTMLKNGNYSYWGTREYSSAKRSNPKYVLIQFGTNDSKPYNWDTHGSEYVGDYKAMISSFTTLNTHPKVFPCLIPPYYLPNPWPTDFPDPSRIPNLVIPAIQQVISDTGSTGIDYYNPLVNKSSLYTDGIHPNVDGAHILAVQAYNAITGSNVAPLTGTTVSYSGHAPWRVKTLLTSYEANTHAEATRAAGAWTGMDLGSGNRKSVDIICFVTKQGCEQRVVGSSFQGSNDMVHWSNLATITAAPSSTFSALHIKGAPAYRYLRYNPASADSDVLEAEFLGN